MKKIFMFVTIFLGILVLTSCSSGNYDVGYNDNNENEDVLLAVTDVPDRKIIYHVNISFDVDDLDDASLVLKTLIASDEWFDYESTNESHHSYVLRIRTSRLDTFIDDMKDEFSVRSYQKEGTDVSIAYQDMSNTILALETQLARLLVLYDEASLDEMIVINQQISDIEIELQSLQGQINTYDSLIDYSEVEVDFYGQTVTTKSPFINRLANGFLNGIDGLIQFLDGFLIVIATILPFVIIFGGGSLTIFMIIKKRHDKQELLKEQNKKNEIKK
jgi:archaellum component FlaC